MIRHLISAALSLAGCSGFCAPPVLKPDIVVASDGSGDFKTIQAAVESISPSNSERIVVFIKNGIYHEKIRVNAPNVTLRGESRERTRIEFPQLNEEFTAHPDALGRAVINIAGADDFVLENLTAENTAGVIGPHAFTVFGTGDRTVIVDCNILSHGADTVSLWLGDRGRYYHARCSFSGSVDFVCPRGWCYVTDCTFYEWKNTATTWHDGSRDSDMKFVLRNCKFDGTNGWILGRHHVDAQFYFLNCSFSKTMADKPIRRVIYPLNHGPATEADIKRNTELDARNLWGEREYFWNCHRDGGDYTWFTNNLTTAPGSPKPEQITAAWTFGETWNPEHPAPPTIRAIKRIAGNIALTFSERVTVKGKPRLRLSGGEVAPYASGSGGDELVFTPANSTAGEVKSLELNGGTIVACVASSEVCFADLKLPETAVAPKQ